MRLSQRLHNQNAISDFKRSHPVEFLLDDEQVTSLAMDAVRMYQGYQELSYYRELGLDAFSRSFCDPDLCISDSEWAIIRPLFYLYVERGNALQLEASRGLGIDVYGRSVSEIQADITTCESELPHKTFCEDIITI